MFYTDKSLKNYYMFLQKNELWLYLSNRTLGNSNGSKVIVDYPVLKTEISTCGSLYKEWKKTKKLYRKAPENGLKIQVEYADTKSQVESIKSNYKPVILALQGAPGSHQGFAPYITHFSKQGARVISPNFPGKIFQL